MTGQVGNPILLTVSFGSSKAALGNVGYTLFDPDGLVYRARATDVVEIGEGDYYAIVVFNEEWEGYVDWDSGEADPVHAVEGIEILPIAPATATVPIPPYTPTTGTVRDFLNLVNQHGSPVTFHRDDSMQPCPCRTKQGFRDPIWHVQHPNAPLCNEAGMLSDPATTTDALIKAFVQPVQSGAVRRLTSEQLMQIFGEVQTDDHVGFFPVQWGDTVINFYEWGNSTEDYIIYNNRAFTSVSANLIPDPADGNPWHHWEVGLRLLG